jgi:hypothetical protein
MLRSCSNDRLLRFDCARRTGRCQIHCSHPGFRGGALRAHIAYALVTHASMLHLRRHTLIIMPHMLSSMMNNRVRMTYVPLPRRALSAHALYHTCRAYFTGRRRRRCRRERRRRLARCTCTARHGPWPPRPSMRRAFRGMRWPKSRPAGMGLNRALGDTGAPCANAQVITVCERSSNHRPP